MTDPNKKATKKTDTAKTKPTEKTDTANSPSTNMKATKKTDTAKTQPTKKTAAKKTTAAKTKTKKSTTALTTEELRATLLAATLPHIAFDGWSFAALERAAEQSGLPTSEILRAFPGGGQGSVRDAVEYFSTDADRRMAEALAELDLEAMRVRDRITTAVRTRLEVLADHQEPVRRALTFLALPPNGPLGLKCLYRTVDAIWRAVGDTSTDYNFYTKRLLLAGVISSTTLVWLNDGSDDRADSWAFLDRRVADVMKVPQAVSRLKKTAEKFPDPATLLRRFAGR